MNSDIIVAMSLIGGLAVVVSIMFLFLYIIDGMAAGIQQCLLEEKQQRHVNGDNREVNYRKIISLLNH